MRRDRALWVALGVLVLAMGAFSLREKGPGGVAWLPPCLFHEFTGWYCAGCGMTRATHSALHGKFLEAFRYNPLGMILLPLGMVWLARPLKGWLAGKDQGDDPNLGSVALWTLCLTILGFWVLRNIPSWPFTLLAPP